VPYAPTPPEDFEPWETLDIQKLVNWFSLTHRLPKSFEINDLLQEAYSHWHSVRHTYRSSAGALPRTYLNRVVKHHLLSQERDWRAIKRGGGEQPLSLDEPFGESEATTRGELLQAPAEHSGDLRIELQTALSKLTGRQRRIVAGLSLGLPQSEIATRIGISRDTVAEERKLIRKVFEDVGLRAYLS
jgi:RNA polymerase sigma factor (sigma-70 family)